MSKYIYNYLKIGDKQKLGFLEITRIISNSIVECRCHKCNTICQVTRSKFALELKKSCGCIRNGSNKICPRCQNINNKRSHKICIMCGYKFDLNSKSFIESCSDLTKYFDFEKNKFPPSNILDNSTQKIWWLCKYGHSYQNTPYQIKKLGSQCPFCSNRRVLSGFNDLTTKNKQMSQEFDIYKNKITPDLIVYGGKKQWWWKCDYGHLWKSNIENRLRGDGCPYCSNHRVLIGFNDIATTHPYILSEWIDELDPTTITHGSHKKIQWKCSKCQHTWKASIVKRIVDNKGCPKCKMSHLEKCVISFLDNNNIKYIPQYILKECKYKRELKFDFFLPLYNIIIECQGIQHYPQLYQNSKYTNKRHSLYDIELIQIRDQIKRNFCQYKQIKLIEIPFWDINNIPTILRQCIDVT